MNINHSYTAHQFGDGRLRQEALRAQAQNVPPVSPGKGGSGPANTQVLSSGIPALDACVGGGFARGELAVSICAHEELNTMLAVQMAAGLAMRGVPGLIFSTVDTQVELADKLARRASNLPVFGRSYNCDQHAPDRAVQTSIQRNVAIADWREQDVTSYAAFRDVLRQASAYFGSCPQWLLVNRFAPDLWHRNPAPFKAPWTKYHEVATNLRAIAQDYNVAVVAFAEGNSGKCRGQRRVDATYAHECPRIGDIAQTVVGVSSLPDDRPLGNEMYSPTQYITAGQYRPGAKGGMIEVSVSRKMGVIGAGFTSEPTGSPGYRGGYGRW